MCKVLYSEFTDALQFLLNKVGRVGVANPSNRAKTFMMTYSLSFNPSFILSFNPSHLN